MANSDSDDGAFDYLDLGRAAYFSVLARLLAVLFFCRVFLFSYGRSRLALTDGGCFS